MKAGLPAIRASEGSGVLMADKHQSEMYLENFTQRNELMEVEILQISRHPRNKPRTQLRKNIERCKDPVSNAMGTVRKVKQERAQGGCLGTKSRRKT